MSCIRKHTCRLHLLLLFVQHVYSTSNFQSDQCGYGDLKCVPLDGNANCLGSSLQYTHTSLDLVNNSLTVADQQKELQTWTSAKSIPKCWDVLKRLLCAVYMPKCEDSRIDMYRRDLCNVVHESCRLAPQITGKDWPHFLQCDQPHFTSDDSCTAKTYIDLTFKDNSSCSAPLVSTKSKTVYFDGVDGCGIQCENPAFTSQEHASIHIFIAVMGFLCLFTTLAASLTFLIDWRNSRKYPSVIIFYVNICFFIGSIGWLAQLAGGARSDIVCRRDGTVRHSEPLVGEERETVACTVIFFIIYYSLMAALVWFVILSYSWHVSFKKLQSGSMTDKLQGKIAYFQIAAWALPLILAIIAMSLQKVDGDSMSGICFVGNNDRYARVFLVVVPVTLSLCIGMVFLVEGVVRLYKLSSTSDAPNNKATSKIRATMIRLGIFTVLAATFVIITIAIHIYEYKYEQIWQSSLREFIICKIRTRYTGNDSECEQSDRPNLAAKYLHILAYFASGVLMSSWTWTSASKDTWKRFTRKLLRLPTNKPVKLKSKHKMIALAFQRKEHKKKGGKVSVDFQTSHDDPLGMRMDVGSVTSHDLSSAWLEAIPKLVARRGGVALPVAGTLRRYSDSDISSIIASRRASLDSQLSDAEKTMKAMNRRRDRCKGTRGVHSADIAAFNARRRGSNVSQRNKGAIKAHFSRRVSNASTAPSDASAHNISFECEDTNNQYSDGSKRSSIDSTVHAGLTNMAHLEQLTLATYSLYTASSSTPQHPDKERPVSRSKAVSSAHPSVNKSTCTSGKSTRLQTASSGYINGALEDNEDLSDISIS